ncbi:DUF4272 domain-containing protein [Corynebacterium sp. zg254]|uniref:DUF4272 domain-containing protein n=2 Tax=Corynebacteriaceae TaxID=1653 RepID=A0ABQ6VF56_9CORY|nr:DUF4272 domain-containing protein [Corynebacterium zhongnanshanii]MCR5914004.1 DUF4272 domain-containing protein [Corynebacterium sp. zg254]
MQHRAGTRGQSDGVAGVLGDLRLVKNNVKWRCGHAPTLTPCPYTPRSTPFFRAVHQTPYAPAAHPLASTTMSTFLNAYSTVTRTVGGFPLEPSSFRVVTASATDPDTREEVEHLYQFENFILRQGFERAGTMTATLLATRNHIRNTHCHYVFEVPDTFTVEDLEVFREWAEASNSVFVMPDFSVRDPRGVDLLDPQVAYGSNAVTAPRPGSAMVRMRTIRGDLWNIGIKIPQNLPAVWSEDELLLRDAESVFNRAVTLSVLGSIAKHVSEGKSVPFETIEAGSKRTFTHLTDHERSFVDAVRRAQPADAGEVEQPVTYGSKLIDAAQPCQDFAFAAAETLGWVVGLTLQAPREINTPNIPAMRKALRSVDREGKDASQLPMQQLDLVADNLEYSTCMRWWDVEHPQTPSLSSFISARLHALTWLSSPHTPWDDIELDV